MVILFFTSSLFHNFSLEIMLTAVQFLLTCVYNVLGRALIILYILTIILVGLAVGLMGGWDLLTAYTHICIYMKQETSFMGTASCLPFCFTQESVQ